LTESDIDSLYLSNADQDLAYRIIKKRSGGRFNIYSGGATTTDDQGGITNIDESATDNDLEFVNLLNQMATTKEKETPSSPAKKEPSGNQEFDYGPLVAI